MTIFMFVNNVDTTLAGAVSSSATSLTLSSAANLPSSIPSGEVLVITLNDQATRQNFEVIYATSVSGSTLSGLLRGQEGTTALSWSTGDFAYSGPTKGQQASFGQLAAANEWGGINTFDQPVIVPPATASNQAVNLGQIGGRLITVRLFTSSTTYTSTTGTNSVIVEVVGNGGGGGAVASTSASQVAASGGGGGGGYAMSRLTSGFNGAAITITAPGNGGAAGGGTGTAGGAISFGGISATGGGGGQGASAVPNTASSMAAGGAGGVGSGGNVLNLNGALGGNAVTVGVSIGAGSGGYSGRGGQSGGNGLQIGGGVTAGAGINGIAGYVLIWEYA